MRFYSSLKLSEFILSLGLTHHSAGLAAVAGADGASWTRVVAKVPNCDKYMLSALLIIFICAAATRSPHAASPD
jgi:hypothetical protein